DFIPFFNDIEVDLEDGGVREVTLHDGSRVVLHKLERDYDPSSRLNAVTRLHQASDSDDVLTGLLYLDQSRPSFTKTLNLVDRPLASLPESVTRPSAEALERINEEFR
ncbi:MAG TPA: 2-oxoacid:ferredoxin oxidoreductase subunit beta, partial [Bryobacteraceae bacterium]|nr:2-oxoacid:ferredoxin oxidoreductase subunit beta [Bryobacteraceae bacterium]